MVCKKGSHSEAVLLSVKTRWEIVKEIEGTQGIFLLALQKHTASHRQDPQSSQRLSRLSISLTISCEQYFSSIQGKFGNSDTK